MPRAMIEIGRALPEVTLYPMPVRPPALRAEWSSRPCGCWRTSTTNISSWRLGLNHKTEADGT